MCFTLSTKDHQAFSTLFYLNDKKIKIKINHKKICKFFTLPFSVLPFILGKKSSTCIPRIKTGYHCLIKESITLKLALSVTMVFIFLLTVTLHSTLTYKESSSYHIY